jgi:hypothetical protein
MRKHSKFLRVIAASALAAAIGLAGSAFTNSNSMPAETQAGDGARAITGYTVSNVHYVLNGTDPTLVDSVTYDLDSTPIAGSTIEIQLASGSFWYSCTNVAAAISCDTTDDPGTVGTDEQADVTGSTNLRVVVAD